MSDPLRLFWLFSIGVVAQRRRGYGPPTLAAMEDDDIAGLLLDRRLVKARGSHVTSFISGSVASFLPPLMLFLDSTVLSAVPSHTLELFMGLLREALPAVRRCQLLFRSSRDGASAAAFHHCCDRKGPTLTLIKDTAGNVFGGYAAVEWTSPLYGKWLNDRAAFLFTVVNPHADPPALFASKAIGCSIGWDLSTGPSFGYDLYVSGAVDDQCCSNIGVDYTNGTRHRGDTVLTGAFHFTPAEVEVWSLE